MNFCDKIKLLFEYKLLNETERERERDGLNCITAMGFVVRISASSSLTHSSEALLAEKEDTFALANGHKFQSEKLN